MVRKYFGCSKIDLRIYLGNCLRTTMEGGGWTTTQMEGFWRTISGSVKRTVKFWGRPKTSRDRTTIRERIIKWETDVFSENETADKDLLLSFLRVLLLKVESCLVQSCVAQNFKEKQRDVAASCELQQISIIETLIGNI